MIKSLSLPRGTWAGLISSLMEAYNMAIYSFSAPLLARWMFRGVSMSRALFFSYCLVLIGSCLLYPTGAIVYGFLGDKIGRQRVCTRSTLGLALATGMMALVPFDWIYFLLLICVQHFFSGGEYQGSIVFAIEHAQREKTGALSALSCLFSVGGLCAASGLATLALLAEDPLWLRSCFLVGALGGLLSYFLKNHCLETPVFSSLPKKDPIHPFLKAQWKQICGATVVFSFFIVSYTFLFLFLPLIRMDHIRTETFGTFQSLVLYGLFLILAGYLADRIGMRKMMLLGTGLFCIAILPLCHFCTHMYVLQGILALFACCVIGPIHGWMLHQFKPEERCRGVFLSSAIAFSLFGGSTVPLCLLLLEQSLALSALYPLTIAAAAFCILQKRGPA